MHARCMVQVKQRSWQQFDYAGVFVHGNLCSACIGLVRQHPIDKCLSDLNVAGFDAAMCCTPEKAPISSAADLAKMALP